MMYDLAETEDFDREEIATYEEVARLFPRPGTFRPIILVGPPGSCRSAAGLENTPGFFKKQRSPLVFFGFFFVFLVFLGCFGGF
jgi:hypothetical protein